MVYGLFLAVRTFDQVFIRTNFDKIVFRHNLLPSGAMLPIADNLPTMLA